MLGETIEEGNQAPDVVDGVPSWAVAAEGEDDGRDNTACSTFMPFPSLDSFVLSQPPAAHYLQAIGNSLFARIEAGVAAACHNRALRIAAAREEAAAHNTDPVRPGDISLAAVQRHIDRATHVDIHYVRWEQPQSA